MNRHDSPRAGFTVANYLSYCVEHLPSALITPEAYARIERLAHRLPGAITSFFGFECPLAKDHDHTDFLVCSTVEEGHAQVLAGQDEEVNVSPPLYSERSWQQVRDFCAAWPQPQLKLHDRIMNIWLEFDMQGTVDPLLRPSMFFGTYPPVAQTPSQSLLAPIRDALALLDNGAPTDPEYALSFVLNALPATAYVFQVGRMWSRATTALRLCVRGLAAHEIVPFVQHLGWAGSIVDLRALIGELAAVSDRLDLDIDVTEDARLDPRLGLECYFGTDRHTGERLRKMQHYLTARALCTEAKGHALLVYQGLTHQDTHAANWPPYLTQLAAARGPDMSSCLLRWVHHIKVVIEPAGVVGAKAYLAVEHHALQRSHLRATIDAARTAEKT